MRTSLLSFVLALAAPSVQACPNGVTASALNDKCVKTTSTQCGDGTSSGKKECAELLSKIAGNANCVKDLLKDGAKYGFSSNMTCTWRPACNIQEIAGIACPKAEPDSTNYETTFSLKVLDCVAAKGDWTLALAKTLDTTFNNIAINCGSASGNDARRLAEGEVQVAVYSKTEADAEAKKTEIESDTFAATLSKEVKNTGQPKPEISATKAESKRAPGYTPFIASVYKPSTGVTGFHEFSSMGKGSWVMPDDGEGKAYMEELMTLIITAVAVGVVFLVFYFIFLCGHACKCCKPCCKCCNQKHAKGGSKIAYLALIAMFVITFISILTAMKGNNQFIDGLRGTSGVLSDTAGIFKTLESEGVQFTQTANKLADVAKTASTANGIANGGCASAESGETLTTLSDSFSTAARDLNKEINDGNPSSDLSKQADSFDDYVSNYVKPVFDGLIALFCVSLAIAIVPLVLKVLGMKNKTLPSIMFRFAHFLLVLTLILFVIAIAVEMLLGVVLSDFCFSGPLNNMQTAINGDKDTSASGGDMLTYFLTCKDAPSSITDLYASIESGKSYANSIKLQASALAMSTPQQCNKATMLPVYEAGGVADQTLDMFGSFADALSCEKTINPLLTRATQVQICTETVDGLYSMWVAHIMACVFLYATLIFAEFVRPYFYEKTEEEEKNGEMYDITVDKKPVGLVEVEDSLAKTPGRV